MNSMVWFTLPNRISTLLLVCCCLFGQHSVAGQPDQCSQSMRSDHIIYDCYGDWAVRHVFNRGELTHRYSDATTLMNIGWFGSSQFQINRRQDGSVFYVIPSQIDRVEITIGAAIFVSEQRPSAVFYGEVSKEMLTAIANATAPIDVMIISEGKQTQTFVSEVGSSAALRWIGAIK